MKEHHFLYSPVYPSIALPGLLLYLAGTIIFLGIITGEIFYPSGYSTSVNDISDLGSTRPPNSVIYQPSATIFNTTMIVAGSMILVASGWVHKFFQKWAFSIPLTLFGLGILGVGIFPGNRAPYHGIFSLLTFVSGGVAAILSYKITQAPFRYVSMVLGSVALLFLFTSNWFIPVLGSGGTERWVAYPILFWLTGMGSYLLGLNNRVKFNRLNRNEE